MTGTNALGAQDWARLGDGTAVTITLPEGHEYPGVVHAKTTDSTVVWIVDSLGERRAFHHGEGVQLNLET